MKFSRYTIWILVQVVLIALTSAAFIWTLSREYILVTSITLCILWIIEIMALIWYLHRNNRQVARFLQSFRFEDGMLHFQRNKKGGAFPDLYREFDAIIRHFSEVRTEREKEFIFYDQVIQHAATGLVATNHDGKILLHNRAFLELFRIRQVRDIFSLDRINKGISNQLMHMKPGRQEMIRIHYPDEIRQLAVKMAEMKSLEQRIRIYSFQDIRTEIEQGEIEAWQKLIRVLNHEIMNSVSPINLLTSSLIGLWEKDGQPKKPEDMDNTAILKSLEGLEVIRKRSKGLTHFVESYRSATRIPEPKFAEFQVLKLFEQIHTLMREEIEYQHIRLEHDVTPGNMTLFADEKLIEQVMINLIKNAIHALKETEEPVIRLSAIKDDDTARIYVRDNGRGIAEDIIDHVFTPLFTTRDGGSGIGLSLSRQIMRMHKGSIGIQSEAGRGTVVTLRF